jgi:hypothetical protein
MHQMFLVEEKADDFGSVDDDRNAANESDQNKQFDPDVILAVQVDFFAFLCLGCRCRGNSAGGSPEPSGNADP